MTLSSADIELIRDEADISVRQLRRLSRLGYDIVARNETIEAESRYQGTLEKLQESASNTLVAQL